MEGMFYQLLQQMKEMTEQLQQQSKQLTALREIIAAKDAQIAALTAHMEELTHKKNSGNRSKPPSSERLNKPAPKSLRIRSGMSAGGQTGHKGSGTKIDREPDEIMEHRPAQCDRGATRCMHLRRRPFCSVYLRSIPPHTQPPDCDHPPAADRGCADATGLQRALALFLVVQPDACHDRPVGRHGIPVEAGQVPLRLPCDGAPATFMSAVSMTYILMAGEGFGLSAGIAYPAGVAFAAALFAVYILISRKKMALVEGKVS